jgi:hypothetical protein
MSLNIFSIVFLVINGALLLLLPRRWAPMPLLVGTCYMTLGQGIQVGSFHFPIIRILIAVGLTRVIIRGERLIGGMNTMDWLMVLWAVWALVSIYFRTDPSRELTFRLGLIFNACGIYFLLRIICKSLDDVKVLCCLIAILLVPVAVAMLYEKMKIQNLFSMLGGVNVIPEIREGKVRASGPFAHSILAGTVGAVCLPLIVGLWQQHRKLAIIGIVACLSMIYTSASSGPIMSAIAAIAALFMWRYRHKMRLVRWLAVLGYIFLDIIMKAPAYYLIARIDPVGGSTGYHRAALIETALNHLNEWWLAGTDYTRHWLPTGVSWNPDQTDITNHYLHLGVIGGLPLMLLFIITLSKGFSFVGQTLKQSPALPAESQFLLWALGSALFTHAVTSLSVAYFDQSFLFVYLTLAAIGSAYSYNIKALRDAENLEEARVT